MGLNHIGCETQSARDTCLTLAKPSRTKHCQDGFNASKCARAEGYGNTLALTNPLPVATLLDSAGSSHRLTAPRYGLTSYCGRSLFTSEEDMRPSPQGLGKKRCCYAVSFPEDDGFALTLPEVARATPTNNFALLALKGRQITDGGERSVTPGQPPPSPYPLPRDAREGVLLIYRARGLRVACPRL